VDRGRELVRTPGFSKLWRYASVSVITTILSLSLLYVFYRVVDVGSAMVANVIATVITTIPSYYLNRTWAWGKSGKSHLWREVVPFWVIAALSLVVSTVAVGAAAHEAHHLSASHHVQTLLVELANLVTYGVMWIGKFVLFNRILFKKPAPIASPAEMSGLGAAGATASASTFEGELDELTSVDLPIEAG
jgi:putative flippase GtrA